MKSWVCQWYLINLIKFFLNVKVFFHSQILDLVNNDFHYVPDIILE